MTTETCLRGKCSVDIELKSNVAKLHNMLSKSYQLLPEVCPELIDSFELVEGEWSHEGCVMLRNYLVEGQIAVDKVRVEKIDDQNYQYIYRLIEGPLSELYKNVTIGYEASAYGEGTLLHYTFEYEKMDKDVPEADIFLPYSISIIKQVDDYLIDHKGN
ncbi:hypothetical protein ACFE04_011258 [Oxalis oulophora]